MRRTVLPVLALAILLALLLWDRDVVERRGWEGSAEGPEESPERAREVLLAEPGPGPEEEYREPEIVAVLRGRVYDPNGRPLARADVSVLRPAPFHRATSDAEGRYELPLYAAGPHLVQASYYTDLRVSRQRIRVQGGVDPPVLDFHLAPTGFVYGEVVADGEPVRRVWADIDRDGEWILDTDGDNGYFTFTDEPPAHVPLVLRVRAQEGLPTEPITFAYRGVPLDLGTIEVKAWPRISVLFVRPDGTTSDDVMAYSAGGFDVGFWEDGRLVGVGGRDAKSLDVDGNVLRARAERDRDLDVVLVDGKDLRNKVRRRLRFSSDGSGLAEIRMTPGPLAQTRLLVDERGRPIPARLALPPEGVEFETDGDGRFTVVLPHSGLHDLQVRALLAPGLGRWIELAEVYAAPFPGFLVDADRPTVPCVFRLRRRLLVVASPGRQLLFRRYVEGKAGLDRAQGAFVLGFRSGPTGVRGMMTEPLRDGGWFWSGGQSPRGLEPGGTVWMHDPGYRTWRRLEFPADGPTIIEIR